MAGYVDIHCHLLPGVDDGCSDLDESLELARCMVDAGIGDAICTPHISPYYPHNEPTFIGRKMKRLQAALEDAGVPLRVHAGGENRINGDKRARDRVLLCDGDSRGGTLGSRFFLFDDWGHHRPNTLASMANRLTADGVTPILAHPERTPWMWDDPAGTADWLAELGIRLQLNAYILAGASKGVVNVVPRMVATADALLDADRYDLLATDAHGPATWPARSKGLQLARQRLGEATFTRLFRDHPSQILPLADS